ncbi:hypothetical protein EV44_g4514 [Erysiphe necator]|uniref:Putative zinc-finger domain-containing protein n=1 Tax=Uncinula necator TaxID=52586 RepID=A0A0B1P4Y4_UNCNE|nr:hypothetical protein EV44_g4514 [Erysiphe necator]
MAESPKYCGRNQPKSYYPQYQNQFSTINHAVYPYNSVPPSFSPSNLSYDSQIFPLISRWNQDTNLPLLSNPQNEQMHGSCQVHDHQDNTQLYPSHSIPNYFVNIPNRNAINSVEIIDSGLQRNFSNIHVPKNQSEISEVNNHVQNIKANIEKKESIQNQDSISPHTMQRQPSDSYSPCVTPLASELPPEKKAPIISTPLPEKNVNNILNNTSLQGLSQNFPRNETKIAPNMKNLSECRREAQKVILNLLPYGVRYETYIDEGFRKDIVDKLFQDLSIDHGDLSNIAHHYNNHLTKENPNIQSENGSNHVSSLPNQLEPITKDKSNLSASAAPTKRSDVIEKEKQLQSDMAERHKTLQTKMDALRKSRELRASVKTGIKSKVDQNPENKPPTNHDISSINEKDTGTSSNSTTRSNFNVTSEPPVAKSKSSVNNFISVTTQNTDSKTPELVLSTSMANQVSTKTPAIPGLFLVPNLSNNAIIETTKTTASPVTKTILATTASPKSSAKPTTTVNSVTTINSGTEVNPTTIEMSTDLDNIARLRKRPVASDFDDQSLTKVPFKRPFGHNRGEQRIVINVSDDESEDEDVTTELEFQLDQESSTLTSIKTSNTSQNMQLGSNLSRPKNFTSPTNTSSTPLSVNTNQSLLTPSILKQKQREIQLMKERIAAAEAQLKAKSTTGSIETRQQSESTVPEIKDNLNKDEISSTEFETSLLNMERVHRDFDQEQIKFTQALDITVEDSALKTDSLQEKILRRQKIATKLPIIESEVEKGRSKLEQLKTEIAEVEAGLEKNLEERNRMTIEMKLLYEEQEYLSASDVVPSVTSENLCNLNPKKPHSEQGLRQQSLPKENVENNLNIFSTRNHSLPPGNTSFASTVLQKFQGEENTITDTFDTLNVTDDSQDKENAKIFSIATIKHDRMTHVENEIQKVDTNQADSIGNSISSEAINKEQYNIFNQCSSNASKSTFQEGEQSIGYILEHNRTAASESESDNYEPPDATVMDRISPLISPRFSPAPPESVELVKNNQTQISDKNQLCQITEPAKINKLLSQNSGISPIMKDEPILTFNSSNRYTPYQSPLKLFKAYRYHPNFKNEVAGGLRSKTYSHNIDANKEFCRFEMAGGICNDSACTLQHFKAITLPDDGIMAALGCPDEFTGESREKFVSGLREVLLGLRLRKVNDFDIIASEIIAHRARFLSDQSKILSLEGITI